MTEAYRTYKYYNEKGDRLAIFGLEVLPGELHISIFRCSKKDQFSKEAARQAFDCVRADDPPMSFYKEVTSPKFSAIIYRKHEVENHVIPVEDGKPKKTFLEYCKSNYFKKKTKRSPFTLYDECLVKADGTTIRTGKTTRIRKVH